MQENNFEGKVQHIMDGFSMTPSEKVWEGVQGQFAQKRKERTPYILFGILLLFLLTSTLWLTDLKQRNSLDNDVLKFTGTIANINETEKPAPELNKDGKLTASTRSQAQNKNKNFTQYIGISSNRKKDNLPQQQNLSQSTIETVITKQKEELLTVNEKTVAKANIESAVKEVQESQLQNNNKESKVTDSISVKSSDQKDLVKEEKKTPESKITETKKAKEKKQLWSVSFSAGLGRSSTSSHYLNTGNFLDYLAGNAAPGGGGFGSQFNVNLPSAAKAGISFKAGFELSRSLSKRISLSSGLYYHLLTTSNTTGSRVVLQSFPNTSRSNALFITGNTNKYINNYHLITLPVSVYTQVANVKGHDITLNTGISFSRLINSNALQFDYLQNSYYVDNTVFNKMLTGVSLAAQINLSSKNKLPIYIGPDFYYSFTPQASSGIYSKSHYQYWGIKLQANLQKKLF